MGTQSTSLSVMLSDRPSRNPVGSGSRYPGGLRFDRPLRILLWGGFLILVVILVSGAALATGEDPDPATLSTFEPEIRVGDATSDVFDLDMASGLYAEQYVVRSGRPCSGCAFEIQVLRSLDNGTSFLGPTVLATASSDEVLKDPQITVGPSGQVTVSWVRIITTTFDIEVTSSVDRGETWFTPVLVRQGAEVGVSGRGAWGGSDLISNPLGDLFLIWREGNGVTTDIVVASSPNGLVWGTPVVVNDDAINNRFMPTLAIDPDDYTLFASWTDERLSPPATSCTQTPCVPGDSKSDLYAARSLDLGVTWETNKRISGATFYNYHSRIAVIVGGDVCFYWDYAVSFITGNLRLVERCFNSQLQNGSGIAFITSGGPTEADQQPSVSYHAATDTIDLVWSGLPLTNESFDYRIFTMRRSSSGAWSPPEQVSGDPNEHPHFQPFLTHDADGNRFVIWRDYREDLRPRIYFTTDKENPPPKLLDVAFPTTVEYGDGLQLFANASDQIGALVVSAELTLIDDPSQTILFQLSRTTGDAFTGLTPPPLTLGEWSLRFVAFDDKTTVWDPLVGNHSFTVVDTVPPVLEHAPLGIYRENRPLTVTLKVTDARVIADMTLHYSLLGAVEASGPMVPQGNDTYAVTIPASLGLGTLTYRFTASDGINSAALGPFVVPIVDPAAPAIIHVPLTTARWGEPVTIRADVNDSEAVAYVRVEWAYHGTAFTVENMTRVSGNPQDGSYSFDLPAILVLDGGGFGTLAYRILYGDSAHDQQYPPISGFRTVVLTDPAAPTISGPGDLEVILGQELLITAQVSDELVPDVRFLQGPADGPITWWQVMAEDDGGLADWDGDGLPTPGLFGLILPSPSIAGTLDYRITAADGTYTTTYPVTGTHTITYIDTTPPLISHTPPTVWEWGASGFLSATITDESVVEWVRLVVSAPAALVGNHTMVRLGSEVDHSAFLTPVSGPGELVYRIAASDGTNINVSAEFRIPILDSRPPSIIWLDPGIQVLSADILLEAEAFDLVGVQAVWFEVTVAGSVLNLTGVYDSINGTYQALLPGQAAPADLPLVVRASDGTWIASDPASGFHTLSIADVTAPDGILAAASPRVVDIYAEIPLILNLTDDVGLSSVTVHLVDGERNVTVTHNVTTPVAGGIRLQLSSAAWGTLGELEVQLLLTDAAGNQRWIVGPPAGGPILIRDLMGPVIIHTPLDESVAGAVITITATWTDFNDSATAMVFWRSEDIRVFSSAPLVGDPPSAVIPAPESRFQLLYYILATDGQNIGRAPASVDDAYRITIVDTTLPILEVAWPSHFEPGTEATVTALVTDDLGVSAVTLYWRVAGESSYRSVSMIPAGNDAYTATFLTPDVTASLEVYVEVSDGTNTVRAGSPEDPRDIPPAGLGFADWSRRIGIGLLIGALVLVASVLVVWILRRPQGSEEDQEVEDTLGDEDVKDDDGLTVGEGPDDAEGNRDSDPTLPGTATEGPPDGEGADSERADDPADSPEAEVEEEVRGTGFEPADP